MTNNSLFNKLKPWVRRPFELLYHAEIHFQQGTDYDRRLALVNFDNSIEVSITTYLTLNPIQRQNRSYSKKDTEEWLNNYHTKIDFFLEEITTRKLPAYKEKDEIVWLHDQRNEQYHGSSAGVPSIDTLNAIRQISIWVFSVLFDIPDVESLLKEALTEAEKGFPEIPQEFVKPKIEGILQKHQNSFFIAAILGGFYENSQDDLEIVRSLTEDFKKWINDIREIKKYNDEVLSLKNGCWQVISKTDVLLKYASFFYDTHLDSIQTVALKVLSGIHPMFDLKPEDRFAAAVYGKIPKYSSELRKGLAETLAFLGVHGSKLNNCTLHQPENTALLVIRELFENADWKLWASLNDLLPLLAEAAPNEFLTSVENALKQSPCPFDELFNQEGPDAIIGSNYMTGLYWALETLAWSEEYLSRAILILAELATHDPGGIYSNRPANSIVTILLPWFPQTTASIDKRIASFRGIQRNFPNIAWKTVINLLPNRHQVSMGSHKPVLQNFIPKDWKQKTTTAEYWEQVQQYATIAVDMAKGNIPYMTSLVENLDNIPQPALSIFLDYLSSEKIINLPVEQKQPIWETISTLVRKHRHFSDAKWALPSKTVDLLEQIANEIAPSNPVYLYQYLFSNDEYVFFNPKLDWHKQQEELLNERISAVKQIHEMGKTDAVIQFAGRVENSTKVGDVFARIAKELNDREFLPDFLDSPEQYKRQFIKGYIESRYALLGEIWIDSLNANTWTVEQKCELLFSLPFELEIWKKVDELLGEQAGIYWSHIDANPFPTQSNLLPAIRQLIQYGRPFLALDCIYAHYIGKKEFFKEEAIQALLKGTATDESESAIHTYHVIEIIKMLQADPQINEDDLFKIEWAFLPLLKSNNNAQPKILEKKLSEEPQFFIEVIRSVYRSKNQDNEQELDETKKSIALNAWELLHEWKRPPGMLDDGSFSAETLRMWYNAVKLKTIESGHYEVAMTYLGQVLFYACPDPSGLWIHQSAAELLDEKENDNIRKGFSLAVFNSRGVYSIVPSGKTERELAISWRQKAEEIEKLGLIRFASSLKELANSYDREAERVISDFGNEGENEKVDGVKDVN